MEKIYDIAYEIDGDTINLEQDIGHGEVHSVALHRIHLQLLAEKMGLLGKAGQTQSAGVMPAPIHDYATAYDSNVGEMHHLLIDCDDDGTINIFQTQVHGSSGSDEHVVLHPVQAVWLGTQLLAAARHAKPISSPVAAPGDPIGDGCPPSVAECTSGLSADEPVPDLFNDIAANGQRDAQRNGNENSTDVGACAT